MEVMDVYHLHNYGDQRSTSGAKKLCLPIQNDAGKISGNVRPAVQCLVHILASVEKKMKTQRSDDFLSVDDDLHFFIKCVHLQNWWVKEDNKL